MIEIIKYTVYSLLGIIILVGIYNQLESKPFKFENFENSEEAEKYLSKHYPVGSDVGILFRDLKKVGAKYQQRSEKMPPKHMGEDKDLEYDDVYLGEYLNNWISSNPIGYWKLYIFVTNKKIALISVVLTF
jgi:hypothetical protein